jgi:glycosyltransferase involved in cell wall biosynthesis
VTRHCLVISAVNFTEGGPLTVLRAFVDAACAVLPTEWDIVVFLHDKSLLHNSRPKLIEIPYAKRSWLRRLRVEWVEFRAHAHRLRPDLWVSLHDVSPNVGPFRQAVYCHNPSPFFRVTLSDTWFEPSLFLFQVGYALLYRVRLRRNCAVVVQQSWLREEFRRWVGPSTRIIVAHPSVAAGAAGAPRKPLSSGRATFLYPALPRAFKNFELICAAVQQLELNPQWRSEVILTISGAENRYARWITRRYSKLRTLRFVGRQTREQLDRLYASADCLLFPSRMETWGLPITEAKQFDLPMLVANLPYARETVGCYDKVSFIDIGDHGALARRLLQFQEGSLVFDSAVGVAPEQPFVRGWPELVTLLTRSC